MWLVWNAPGGPGSQVGMGEVARLGPFRRPGGGFQPLPKASERAVMSMRSGVIGGVIRMPMFTLPQFSIRAAVRWASSRSEGTARRVSAPLSRSETRYSPALGGFLRSPRLPRYCVDVPNAMKKTTKKRMNNAMPAHLSTGLHIASLAPRRPSRWTAAFRTIHVHRSDRNARLR